MPMLELKSEASRLFLGCGNTPEIGEFPFHETVYPDGSYILKQYTSERDFVVVGGNSPHWPVGSEWHEVPICGGRRTP